jgi:fructose-1,6-bisphosphatase I
MVCMMISEELPEAIVTPPERAGKYVVAFDPLDGSSNIECNVSIGSIFAIYERTTDAGTACDVDADALQRGTKLVAAGYCMYGAATVMVLSMGAGVVMATLDPSLGEFLITNTNLRLPSPGKRIYSVNEGNLRSMPKGIQDFVAACKAGEKPYSLRYVGSMVADVHRTLCYGGVFLYPKTMTSPSGKLRLLYESNPMAFLVEQAGGAATTGSERILDLDPANIHCRCPVILGSPRDVDDIIARLAADDAAAAGASGTAAAAAASTV